MKHLSSHQKEIYDWIKSYLPDEEEAYGLMNQIHYLSVKRSKSVFVIGLVFGAISMAILLKWVS